MGGRCLLGGGVCFVLYSWFVLCFPLGFGVWCVCPPWRLLPSRFLLPFSPGSWLSCSLYLASLRPFWLCSSPCFLFWRCCRRHRRSPSPGVNTAAHAGQPTPQPTPVNEELLARARARWGFPQHTPQPRARPTAAPAPKPDPKPPSTMPPAPWCRLQWTRCVLLTGQNCSPKQTRRRQS